MVCFTECWTKRNLRKLIKMNCQHIFPISIYQTKYMANSYDKWLFRHLPIRVQSYLLMSRLAVTRVLPFIEAAFMVKCCAMLNPVEVIPLLYVTHVLEIYFKIICMIMKKKILFNLSNLRIMLWIDQENL